MSQNLVQVFFFFSFFVFQKSSSICRENEIFQKSERKKKTNITLFWVETWSNYVAQHAWAEFWRNLGPSFDSTFLTFLGPFHFSKYAETTLFIVFSAKICIFSPPPKKLGTLFVNTTALTDFFLFVRFFLHFAFLGFCCVRFWGVFFERNEKQKKTKFKTKQQKGKITTRCKQQNHLVLFLRKKPDNTDTT